MWSDLAAFRAHSQDAVAVLVTEVVDAGPAGVEDPESEQTEECDEREGISETVLPYHDGGVGHAHPPGMGSTPTPLPSRTVPLPARA